MLLSRCVLTLGRAELLARALLQEGSLPFPPLLQRLLFPRATRAFEAAQRVRKVRAQPRAATESWLPRRQPLPWGRNALLGIFHMALPSDAT